MPFAVAMPTPDGGPPAFVVVVAIVELVADDAGFDDPLLPQAASAIAAMTRTGTTRYLRIRE